MYGCKFETEMVLYVNYQQGKVRLKNTLTSQNQECGETFIYLGASERVARETFTPGFQYDSKGQFEVPAVYHDNCS